MKLFGSEDKRRELKPNFDTIPTFIHEFNFQASRNYIKDKVVLDIGCWSGQLEQLIQKTAKKIVAIDPSPQAILFARKRLPNVKFMVARAEKLPFLKSSFDTVFLMDVLEHVKRGSEIEVLRQIYKVIRPAGTLIISTPNKHPLSMLLDPAYFLLGHRHYGLEEICQMLTDTGFKIRKKRIIGNSYGLMYAIISLIFKYTLGFEPKILQRCKSFLLKEYSKKGYAFLFVIAKAIK